MCPTSGPIEWLRMCTWRFTVKILKFWTPKKFAVIILKFDLYWFSVVMPLNNVGGMAKSADPDQTAPLGAVWSGSALFAQTWLSKNLGTLRYYEDNAKVAVHMGRLKYSLELHQSHATYKHKPNTVRFSSYKTAFSFIFGAHFNSGYQF